MKNKGIILVSLVLLMALIASACATSGAVTTTVTVTPTAAAAVTTTVTATPPAVTTTVTVTPTAAPVPEVGPVIDLYTHVLPADAQKFLVSKMTKDNVWWSNANTTDVRFLDPKERITAFEKAKGAQAKAYSQVLTLYLPPIEQAIANPADAIAVCKVCNDSMAKWVKDYPDKFIAWAGVITLNNVAGSVAEIERCSADPTFKGILLYASPDFALDSTDYKPIYDKIVEKNLIIWIHPGRNKNDTDYIGEKTSAYNVYLKWGWVMDTTVAVNRLVYSGFMKHYPTIKIVLHHGGGYIPALATRITDTGMVQDGPYIWEKIDPGTKEKAGESTMPYFKQFYVDTAGIPQDEVKTSFDFYGVDRVLFGTDNPYNSIETTIKYVQGLGLSAADQDKILQGNTKKLLGLK